MAFPPISVSQAVQLGIAAHAVGSAASSAFSELLRSAADFLTNREETPTATAPSSVKTGLQQTAQSNRSDVSVLSGQIESLLRQFHSRVKQLIAGNHAVLPDNGLTVSSGQDGQLAISGNGADQDLTGLLRFDDLLGSLFRALEARQRLLHSATSGTTANGSVPFRLQVSETGVRPV